jgi:hypothetical protein
MNACTWRVAACFALLAGTSAPANAQGRCSASPRVATPFAPELSDSGRVFGGMFTAAGDELFYFHKQPPLNAEKYHIVTSRRGTDGRWSAPKRLELGGDFSDMYPAMSPDGRRLVFATYRRAPGDTTATPNASLFEARRAGDGWSAPVPIPTLAAHGYYHSQVRFDGAGNLYFRRSTPDYRATETLVARPAGASFAAPQKLDAVHRWTAADVDGTVVGGTIAPGDSLVILEVRARNTQTGRLGWADLFVTRQTAAGYTHPMPLGASVNDPVVHETFTFFSPDGCDLLFVRNFSGFFRVGLAEAMR